VGAVSEEFDAFQIETSDLSVSMRAQLASKEVPRCAAVVASTTARSPTDRPTAGRRGERRQPRDRDVRGNTLTDGMELLEGERMR
jgi:hypothetical protein